MDGISAGHALALAGLYLGLLAGLAAIPLGLGGNFILFGLALVTALATHFRAVPWWALLGIAGMVAVGEILEAVLGSLAARRFGSSRWGMIGAFVGGLVGVIPGTAIFPVIGSVIGSFAGAALGAVLLESIHRREWRAGLSAGWGAFLGKLGAVALKLAIGFAIAAWLVVRTWPG